MKRIYNVYFRISIYIMVLLQKLLYVSTVSFFIIKYRRFYIQTITDHNKLSKSLNFLRIFFLCFKFDWILRVLDGRDHLYTVLIFFKRRAEYKHIGKYTNSKNKIYGFFRYLKILYRLSNHILIY